MNKHKFDPTHFAKLDNPERQRLLPVNSVLAHLNLIPGQTVADVGCGIGYFTFPLAQNLGSQGTVYALDISPEMLAEARRRYQQQPTGELAQVQFVQSQENGLPLEDGQVDLVFMANVLHELQQPTFLLQEVNRVLKPQGKIAVVDWRKIEMPMGPPVDHRLSADEAEHLLVQSGFNALEVSEVGTGHYLLFATKV